MKRIPARRGSALLIVLGMVAFMVVSAVAFSAYMRSARLPSSYLRRTSSSRLLAKAALAEAVEAIDTAIGNNPHPGVGTTAYKYPRTSGSIANRNWWAERVFIGSTNLNSSAISENFASPDETVSVLNVEALAYLPPPIINEVRYYSRRSTAALWHDLAFDSGRYAFCAVDVSDCFDVNRVTASSGLGYGGEREIPAGRSSSDTGRITLAHSFEDATHKNYAVKPKEWDKFMDDYVSADGGAENGKIPLVSVADMNLAIHSRKPGGMTSPFGEYADFAKGSSGRAFVQSESGTASELLRGEMFVTDSLFTSTNAPGRAFDISRSKYQPFSGFPADKNDNNEVGVDDMLSYYNNEFVKRFVVDEGLFGDPEFIQLYDYLDVDAVPVSLALPTVERVPMVTGVMLDAEDFAVAVDKRVETKAAGNNQQYAITLYDLKFEGSLHADVGLVYPFKYDHGEEENFYVQAAATITMVPKGTADKLRRGSAKAQVLPAWGGKSASAPSVQYLDNAPVVTMISSAKPVTLPSAIATEQQAVIAEIELDLGRLNNAKLVGEIQNDRFNDTKCTVGVSQLQKKGGDAGWVDVGDPTEVVGAFPLRDTLNGSLNPGEDEFVPVVQVWVRVLNSGEKTVDLVPACASDDSKTSFDVLSSEVNAGSAVRPLLRFSDETSVVKYTSGWMNGAEANPSGEMNVRPKVYVTDDPRFNYAPENFIALDEVVSSVSGKWFDLQRSAAADRDGDIFMGVSDAGYLQSIYEFANLLNITGFRAGNWGVLAGNAYNGERRTSFANCPADKAMWRTYSQCDLGSGATDLAKLFAEIETGSKGFRVNPYTPSKSVMLAALANTPFDWWAASTNIAIDAKKDQFKSIENANAFTFSEHDGAEVKLEHARLEQLAEAIIGELHGSNSGRGWENVFDGLNWGSDEAKELCGVEFNVPLHSVDRKFLHGFWRECFATRQQLFLVFVRAEPTMMGGGASGKTPPQLGARAVALVWRDPAPTAVDAGGQPRPHRSRILFYRQFD